MAGTVLVGVSLAVKFGTRGGRASVGHEGGVFLEWQKQLVRAAAARIAAHDESASRTSMPTADDLDVAGFVEAWLGRMNARTARDLRRFLTYLEYVAPLTCGLFSRFTRLGPREQDRVLTSVQSSQSHLLRAGFDGLKALVFMGYYRDPRTWAVLGYDGPLRGRPAGGWH